MSEIGDEFKARRDWMKERKRRLGLDCPGCPKIQPKRIPTRLMPGQMCKVCGYVRSAE